MSWFPGWFGRYFPHGWGNDRRTYAFDATPAERVARATIHRRRFLIAPEIRCGLVMASGREVRIGAVVRFMRLMAGRRIL